MNRRYLEIRVFMKDIKDDDIEDIAEDIKDAIYDYEGDNGPVDHVTYEIIDDMTRIGDTVSTVKGN